MAVNHPSLRLMSPHHARKVSPQCRITDYTYGRGLHVSHVFQCNYEVALTSRPMYFGSRTLTRSHLSLYIIRPISPRWPLGNKRTWKSEQYHSKTDHYRSRSDHARGNLQIETQHISASSISPPNFVTTSMTKSSKTRLSSFAVAMPIAI
jgi:hypothetical protein